MAVKLVTSGEMTDAAGSLLVKACSHVIALYVYATVSHVTTPVIRPKSASRLV